MTSAEELEYLREHCDSQTTQISTLQEHLEQARNENDQLKRNVALLEQALDNKNAEISRLSQIAQGIYLA